MRPPEGRISQAPQWFPPAPSLRLPWLSFCLAALLLRLSDLRFLLPAAAGCPSSAASRSPSSMALLKAKAWVVFTF